jgi:hypothetical protein
VAQRAEKLRTIIHQVRKTADQTQRSFMKAEGVLTSIEDRERQREARGPG